MITRRIKQHIDTGYEWVIEEYDTEVICPECGSEDVWFADEPQPCDGTEPYDGLTYSIICNKCAHLFYEYEDLDTTLC